jgi:hypothetical protein
MSNSRVAAAAITALVAVVHSLLGERYILVRLFRREDLPKLFGGSEFTKQTLRLAWHITSVAFLGLGALVLMLPASVGGVPSGPAQVIAATYGVSGLVALVCSRGRHLSWIAFFAVAALVWWG